MSSPYDELTCPMAACGERLMLDFSESLGLTVGLLDETEHVTSSDSECGTWKVECLSGHVLLLPDTNGCLCEPEDQEGEDCGHDPDDYEWSTDGPMKFRNIDRLRLRAVIERLGGST